MVAPIQAVMATVLLHGRGWLGETTLHLLLLLCDVAEAAARTAAVGPRPGSGAGGRP